MRIKLIIYLSLLGFLLFGCAGIKKTVENSETASDIKPEYVVKVESFNENISKDFRIIESIIHEDILEIQVSYSGGCAEHDFTMYSTQQYQKSLPPKLPMFLVHDNGGDACRASKTETLLFDIKELRYEGQKAVQLIINKEHTVDYNY